MMSGGSTRRFNGTVVIEMDSEDEEKMTIVVSLVQ